MANYGKVRYLGEKPTFSTRAYEPKPPDLEPNPEGGFLYEFTPQRFELPIQTRLDLDFFSQRPNVYEVILPSGKPVRKSEPKTTVQIPASQPGAGVVGSVAPGTKKKE